ncbi:MAG: helix-turn-helix domain-containing protein [Acidimicrobiales bacterium]
MTSAGAHLGRKPLLSVEETAILLGQSRSSIYRAIDKGDLPLPVVKISGRWRVPRRAVERLLEGESAAPRLIPAPCPCGRLPGGPPR